MRALTPEQMQDADARGAARVGDVALMRAAGECIATAIARLAPEGPVIAFAGPGNNGGDAFAALALVDSSRVRVVYALEARKPSEARSDAEQRARESGVDIRPFPSDENSASAALAGAALAVDALLGTGSRSAPDGAMVRAIAAINALDRKRVLAVDLPTGIDSATGSVSAQTVRAGSTVTLGSPKLGLLLEPAREYAGALYVGDIGLEPELARLLPPVYSVLTPNEFRALLPRRAQNADKRSAGAPLVVAGSRQFPGAAVLCALGAARSGAGYVTVAAPESAAEAIRAHLVEQVVVTYDERDPDAAVATLCDLTNHCSSVAIGPGLGLGDAFGTIVRDFIARLELPFVVDASGLFHLAKHLSALRGKRCVLTPHAGEFARLSGEGTVSEGDRVKRLRNFVARTSVTTLLKGLATLIDDGSTLAVNPTGTNALATAGTGDVLTGMIATLLAQGLEPFDAARAGAYWHGLAGGYAQKQRTVGVIAEDVAEALAPALDFAPAPLDGLTRIF